MSSAALLAAAPPSGAEQSQLPSSSRNAGMVGATSRRRVAVLFADISGFTRLVESVDPETVYRVVRPLLDQMVLLVRRYGGEIQQVLGDGFMTVFGLHATSGDEAARAIRAGLAVLGADGAGGADYAVHAGIEYGEVLITPSWEPAGYAVWGRAVNLAQRLCEFAGPGELYLGPSAFARAGHDLGSATSLLLSLNGIAGTILANRIVINPVPELAPHRRQVGGAS
jgi:class 3 adenylate cyclase